MKLQRVSAGLSNDTTIGSHMSEGDSILVTILFARLRRMGSAPFLDCHVEGLSWQFGDLAIPPRLSKNSVSESPNFGREALTNHSLASLSSQRTLSALLAQIRII